MGSVTNNSTRGSDLKWNYSLWRFTAATQVAIAIAYTYNEHFSTGTRNFLNPADGTALVQAPSRLRIWSSFCVLRITCLFEIVRRSDLFCFRRLTDED
jgi:hypothetical protein